MKRKWDNPGRALDGLAHKAADALERAVHEFADQHARGIDRPRQHKSPIGHALEAKAP